MTDSKLRVVVLKPSKYGTHGFVERFRRGFMPNGTVPYIRSLTPPVVSTASASRLTRSMSMCGPIWTIFNFSITPMCQLFLHWSGSNRINFHRSLDLAAYALSNGVKHCMKFGYELAPLPNNLELSEADAEFNRMGKAQ